MPRPPATERGAAVVDFVLVLVVVVPLFLGIFQVGAGAARAQHPDRGRLRGSQVRRDGRPARGRGRRHGPGSRSRGALAARFARDVTARPTTVDGAPGVEVEVTAEVPPLGLWGPGSGSTCTGHAIEEVAP